MDALPAGALLRKVLQVELRRADREAETADDVRVLDHLLDAPVQN